MIVLDEGFKHYLHKRGKGHMGQINDARMIHAFIWWLDDQGLTTMEVRYHEVMDYVGYCRQNGNSQNTVANKVGCIKRWYAYKNIYPNPCAGWHIKRRPFRVPEGLLTEVQLNQMYHQHPASNAEEKRDKVILGLMIYQALCGGALQRIKWTDVHMDAGFIVVVKTLKSAGRSIKIHEHQYPLLKEYMEKTRMELLNKGVATDGLIINGRLRSRQQSFYHIYYQRLRKCCDQFRSVKQIRASVITNWLKSNNLREVQYRSGHRYVSSTERYLQHNVVDLQKLLDELHPLK